MLSCVWTQGFGSRVLAYDIREDPAATALGVEYVSKERLLEEADILSLHCPLLPSTYHIIDAKRCACALWFWQPGPWDIDDDTSSVCPRPVFDGNRTFASCIANTCCAVDTMLQWQSDSPNRPSYM